MELTTNNLINEVRKLAEEQPDFVYPKTMEALKDEKSGESNTMTCFLYRRRTPLCLHIRAGVQEDGDRDNQRLGRGKYFYAPVQ